MFFQNGKSLLPYKMGRFRAKTIAIGAYFLDFEE